ncbi:MAG: serine acetyltransferase [Muribaculaceae bacterium]|nr:serine acetyltransferase [Muribaculaceae bacterium]MDE6134451.1 serine acetyltransferase [Muribaculaceae bacterium]
MKILSVSWTLVCTLLTVGFLNEKERRLIAGDTARWAQAKETECTKWFFINLFAESCEFRSVVYYRLRRRFRLLPSIFLKGQVACHICSRNTGKGLLLVHGYSTIINSDSVGENCTFFQNVTIGHSKGHTPVIGNNCVFGCGSIVIGNVRIGNNVIVGAGALVRQDIPDNSVAVGNPCRIYPKDFKGEILDYI